MLKTATFAVLHFAVAFSVAYLLTGNIGISGAVALIEPLANTVVFYVHERVWQRFEKRKSHREHFSRRHQAPLQPCAGS